MVSVHDVFFSKITYNKISFKIEKKQIRLFDFIHYLILIYILLYVFFSK
jgi:hypothetical protein